MSHIVTVIDGKVVDVTCDEDACHYYPACDCEQWTEDHYLMGGLHAPVRHNRCSIQVNFDYDNHWMYNENGPFDFDVPEGLTRSGEIYYEWDECLLWNFKTPEFLELRIPYSYGTVEHVLEALKAAEYKLYDTKHLEYIHLLVEEIISRKV